MKTMNKIVGIFLGIAMSASIGVGIWSGHKDFTPVYAEEIASAFDFEDSTAHRASGQNSYAAAGNTYTENNISIALKYADSITTGTPLNGTANILGRVAKNTTNSPSVIIGPFSTTLDVSKITFLTKGVKAMSMVVSYSSDNSNYITIKTISSMPTAATTETIEENISLKYLKFQVTVVSSTTSNRDFQLDDITFYQGEVTPIEPPELDHAGTLADPYSVADSRALIDYAAPEEQVYIKGIVHKAYDYNTTYNNITFFFSDDGTETDDMEAYRCIGTDAENVEVGDTVILYGILMKYNTTYELAEGCELISLIKPQSDDVSAWCISFLATVTCDGGITPPSTDAWGQMKTSFLALSSEDQLSLKILNNDATARYDYIIGKYGSNVYEDFIGRNPIPFSRSLLLNTINTNTTNGIVIIIISMISITAIGSYLFIRKRKEQ